MRSFLTSSILFRVAFAVALASSACSSTSEKSCTLELRTAVRVQIESPGGLPISAVTAEHGDETECELSSNQDAARVEYLCYERGPGLYTVHVKSGAMTWTQAVDVPGDECHVSELKTLVFVLESSTAD